MANIILTSYCNLHCPYCFADNMIKTEDIKNISLDQFKRTLKWIGEDAEEIGLIGGEPTLHPQFNEILDIIKNYSNSRRTPHFFTLFTNGIYLDKYIQNLPPNMGILINVNQPQAMTTEQYAKMIKNIATLSKMGWCIDHGKGRRVTLGCNICQEITNYNFIWDITKAFNITDLRISVVAPTKKEQLENKEEYYNLMKPIFLNFVKKAIENKVRLHPDCNQIPGCYFSEEEIKLFNKVYAPTERKLYFCCKPVIDISIDFSATSCFGCYQRIDCNNFKDLEELERYMIYKVMAPKIACNNQGKCKTCKKFEFLQCQGGCLAFGRKGKC